MILLLAILRRLDCILERDRETVRALAVKYDNPNRLKIEMNKATGRSCYNTSNYSVANLLADADGLADNLANYIDRFSPDVDVFQYFEFKKEILALDKAELLREVITPFNAVDLHPDVVSSADMGDAFECSQDACAGTSFWTKMRKNLHHPRKVRQSEPTATDSSGPFASPGPHVRR